jgi:hypothetical protein
MTTSKTSFDGAVYVLTDSTRAHEIAEIVRDTYFQDSEYHFTVTESTPEHIPVDLRDQIEASRAKAGAGATVLVVYPWAATESTLPERTRNGKIPS